MECSVTLCTHKATFYRPPDWGSTKTQRALGAAAFCDAHTPGWRRPPSVNPYWPIVNGRPVDPFKDHPRPLEEEREAAKKRVAEKRAARNGEGESVPTSVKAAHKPPEGDPSPAEPKRTTPKKKTADILNYERDKAKRKAAATPAPEQDPAKADGGRDDATAADPKPTPKKRALKKGKGKAKDIPAEIAASVDEAFS